jgi:hypothetical protein
MDKEKIIDEVREILFSEGVHRTEESFLGEHEISVYSEDDLESAVDNLAEYVLKIIKRK